MKPVDCPGLTVLTRQHCGLCSGIYLSDQPPGKYPCPVCWFRISKATSQTKKPNYLEVTPE